MNDMEILGQLVKSRERCRQLAQWYQKARSGEGESDRGFRPDAKAFQDASWIVSRMLSCLRSLPNKPTRHIADGASRANAERLLRELSDLIETVLVAEREFRERMTRSRRLKAGGCA